MESIYGYIGLSSRLGEESESGLYVDALPDISITLVEKLTDQVGETFEDLWSTIEKRGVLKFRTLFLNALNKCYKVKSMDTAECLIEENLGVMATSLWYLLGAELMFERASSARLNRYTTIEKGKAKELRDAYMQIFHDELTAAVNSIDLYESDCIEECPSPSNIISTHYVQL